MLPQRKRTRLEGFNYRSDRLYFITCCVKHMRHCFGEVVGDQMQLNTYGLIADAQWCWLADQYPYVQLYAHIIMPNHMHGILEIDSERVGLAGGVRATRESPVRHEPFHIKIKSLSELMGAYKTTASKKIHLAGDPAFAWHRSFYDHIIRDEKAYHRITNYIANNPAKWEEDRWYKEKAGQ